MHHHWTLIVTMSLTWTYAAHAEYATPPDARPQGPYEPEPAVLDHPPAAQALEQATSTPSTVRVHAGPALRLRRDGTRLGAWGAVDVGEQATGLRVAGTWVDAGAIDGSSQYTTEFWLDMGSGRRFHPVVGAGAGIARLGTSAQETTDFETITLGIGLLRAGMQVALPVHATDARASLEAIGCLPVVGPRNVRRDAPWGLIVLAVGIGL